MDNKYFIKSLQKSISAPNLTQEQLKSIVENTELFFQVLAVKLQSRDPELRDQAAKEIGELRSLLEKQS